MDKRALLDRFGEIIAHDLAVITQAALAAQQAATHAESKAEDQYDTRGLEASYLAGAQSKRALALEELRSLYRYVEIKLFDNNTAIAATAVVQLESDGKFYYYLLMPLGGGMSCQHDGNLIQVVTPQSPIGEALLGKHLGDQIEIEIQGKTRDFDIVAIW